MVYILFLLNYRDLLLEGYKMSDLLKQKLVELGAEPLAEALLEVSRYCDVANELIERLIATPEENIKRIKRKISGLKRLRRFIDWRGSYELAQRLKMLIEDLRTSIDDPLTGVELVAAFYETDKGVLGHCDDSDGYVGDIFRIDAKELFIDYASRCTDKKKVADIISKLNYKDDYGVRSTLIDCAGQCLPEPVIRSMISKFQRWADKEEDKHRRRYHFMMVEFLARQLLDAKLFEEAYVAAWGKLSTAAIMDIASIYLERGEVDTAYLWLKKIPEGETYQADKRDKLLIEIYKRQGDTKKLTDLLYRKLRSRRSIETLNALLDVIGDDKRDKVIKEEVALIMESPKMSEVDAEFLISVEKFDEAATYILRHSEQLNGDHYWNLLHLGKVMESKNQNLAASLIYRSLLLSILKRAYVKAYPHGVKYLKS